jgi:DNA-3-methyladenine glycosylase
LAAKDAIRLDRAFFARPTVIVARDLLGAVLHTHLPEGDTAGRIVETEAYLGADDLASHASRLKAGRVRSMYGEPGIAYVYRSYGMHAMLNVVTEGEGAAGAVLIRALEPLTGLDLMAARRGTSDERLLCSGPGRLCQAMGIRLDHHGVDLTESDEIFLTPGEPPASISASGRIGVSRGREEPWRFFVTDSRFVSAHRRGDIVEVIEQTSSNSDE